MGVKGFLYMLKLNYKEALVKDLTKTDILLIDGNCIIHEIISNYTHLISPNLEDIIANLLEKFESVIKKHLDKDVIHICLDGVPPMPKQLCQKRRRRDNFSISAFILPGTDIMNVIERELIRTFQCDFIYIMSSNNIGEGEQKMIQILKTIPSKSATLVSHDSDVVILTLLQNRSQTFVEIPSFNMIIDIDKLLNKLKEESLLERLLWACVLCGNDFFPQFRQFKKLSTIEIFNLLKKNVKLKSFKDLEFEHTCSCDKEDAKSFNSLWNWYKIYFTTNTFISTDPYISDESPCVYCIVNCEDEKLFTNSIDKSDHLSYVLTENHKNGFTFGD
jgi:5'-3' exonuclease